MEEKETKEVEIKYDASGDREEKVKIVEPFPDVQKQFEKIWETQ